MIEMGERRKEVSETDITGYFRSLHRRYESEAYRSCKGRRYATNVHGKFKQSLKMVLSLKLEVQGTGLKSYRKGYEHHLAAKSVDKN